MALQPEFRIKHIATGKGVTFLSYYLTEFQDNISTKYSETPVYGRMDPIVNYQGTTRKITVGLEITKAALSAEFKDLNKTLEAGGLNPTLTVENMYTRLHGKISDLKTMQYPVYEDEYNAMTIQRPPLVTVELANLIRDPTGGPLICAMQGFSFTPKTGFTPLDTPLVVFGAKPPGAAGKTTIGQASKGDADFQFNTYTFRFDFTPLHKETLGFKTNGAFYDFLGGGFFGPV
jgi:hypothetical protein